MHTELRPDLHRRTLDKEEALHPLVMEVMAVIEEMIFTGDQMTLTDHRAVILAEVKEEIHIVVDTEGVESMGRWGGMHIAVSQEKKVTACKTCRIISKQ